FIKTDTDGQEDKVILGAKDTIAKFKPLIFIEIKHNDIGAKLLKEWGYESIHESDNHMNLLMKHKDN
ncbi:MAG: FkbM family methyltransferase, partial [Nitrososphaera sp.]